MELRDVAELSPPDAELPLVSRVLTQLLPLADFYEIPGLVKDAAEALAEEWAFNQAPQPAPFQFNDNFN